MMCHRIRGTPAGGTVAPDLTHVASRTTLAAGTLPMSRGNLAAWIVDPQGIKPGAHMPVVRLDGDELNARRLSGRASNEHARSCARAATGCAIPASTRPSLQRRLARTWANGREA